MEERITIADLREMLDAVNSGDVKKESSSCRQISLDFAEMKKNPAKVLIVAALSHLTVNVSN